MKSKYAINVYSEIGKLKTVLLHHRGEELLILTPNLSIAQVEHHQFVKILIEHDVEYTLKNLLQKLLSKMKKYVLI